MEISYQGTELELFQKAVHWKQYLKEEIGPYLTGDVLELGAGIGANTKLFLYSNPKITSWTCVEPDPKLANKIDKNTSIPLSVVVGTLFNLTEKNKFDTAIYIDVLEHIENDREELLRLVQHLKPLGKLIILSPAHQFLFSSFDKKQGHHRRYNKKSLMSVIPSSFKEISIYYLDSLGILASLFNRLILNAESPTPIQIQLWDEQLVRVSKFMDPIFGKKFGKSILGIWRKQT